MSSYRIDASTVGRMSSRIATVFTSVEYIVRPIARSLYFPHDKGSQTNVDGNGIRVVVLHLSANVPINNHSCGVFVKYVCSFLYKRASSRIGYILRALFSGTRSIPTGNASRVGRACCFECNIELVSH